MSESVATAVHRCAVLLQQYKTIEQSGEDAEPALEDLDDAIRVLLDLARALGTKCAYLAAWEADERLCCGHAGKNPWRDLFNDSGCISCGQDWLLCSHTRDHRSGVDVTEAENEDGATVLCATCSDDLLPGGEVDEPCSVCNWAHSARKPRGSLTNIVALGKMMQDDSPLTDLGKFFLGKAMELFGVPPDDPVLHARMMRANFIEFDGTVDELEDEWTLLEFLHDLDTDPDSDAAVFLLLASNKQICPLSFKTRKRKKI
jgi:hypothetical protein